MLCYGFDWIGEKMEDSLNLCSTGLFFGTHAGGRLQLTAAKKSAERLRKYIHENVYKHQTPHSGNYRFLDQAAELALHFYKRASKCLHFIPFGLFPLLSPHNHFRY